MLEQSQAQQYVQYSCDVYMYIRELVQQNQSTQDKYAHSSKHFIGCKPSCQTAGGTE